MQPPASGVELHRSSHAELLERWYQPTKGVSPALEIDAIVVPAAYVDAAAKLATQLGCRLVVLCSNRATGLQVAERLASQPGLNAAVIEAPVGWALLQLTHWGAELKDVGQWLLRDFLDRRTRFINQISECLQAVGYDREGHGYILRVKCALETLVAARNHGKEIESGAASPL